MWAVNAGRNRAAALLIEAGADVNHRVGDSIPLHTAAYSGHFAMVELLVSRGANIHSTTAKGDTALHRAVGDLHSSSVTKPITEGRLAVVDLLLRHGASVKAAGFLGDKPLHLAATRGYVEAVELLLQHGADVDAPDESGSTPLHHAAMHGRVDVSAQLLSRGANVNARSQHNTPLSLAVRFNHNDVVALLLKYGGDVRFVSNQGKTLFDELMDSSRPWTPQRGDLAKLLLDAGIDIHDGARKQGTPLHRAVQRERIELAEALDQSRGECERPRSAETDAIACCGRRKISEDRGNAG